MEQRGAGVGWIGVGQTVEADRLLEQVCRQIIEELDATSCSLSQWVRAEDTVTTWVTYAHHPELGQSMHVEAGESYPLADCPTSARVLQDRVVVGIRVDDPQADASERARLEEAGQQSFLMLPLVVNDEVIGLLKIFQRDRPRSFTEKEVALAGALAGQVGIAIKSVQLFHGRERRITELSMVNELGQALSSALQLKDLLELVHQQINRIFDTTNFYIATYREGSDEWMMAFHLEQGQRQPPGPRQLAAGLTGHIIRSRRPLLLRTLAENIAFDEQEGIPLLGEQARSWLGVPLISADKRVGVMAIQNYEQENLYDEDDLDLFSTIAGQVASALDNLQLLEETRRRAWEMEVINEVGRTLTSVLDLDELLQQIVDITKDRFEHYFVIIALVEEGHLIFRRGSMVGDSGRRLDLLEVTIDLIEGPSLVAEAVRTCRPVLVDDVLDDPRYLAVEELPDTRSELVVPIWFKDRVIGALDVQSDRPRAYDQSDVALVQALANQAGVAIENARSFQEREQRITEQSIVTEIGQALSSALELEELLDVVHRQVSRVFDTANFYIATYEVEVDEWESIFHLERGERQPTIRHKVGAGLTGYIIRNRKPILLRDSADYTVFHREQGIDFLLDPALSWLGVPLLATDKLVGVMAVQSYEEEGLYDEHDQTLLSTIGAQVAIAIENARLYSQVQEQLEELRHSSETQFRLLEQVRQLSTPVLPVHDRILILPLIGVVDSERIWQLTERLLETVRQQRAQVVLLDITGVPLVDTAVAQALLQASEATRLLGAEVVLVGVRAEVAQTLVTLGLSMEDLVTRSNLQSGLEYALGQLGRRISDAL